MTTPAEHPSRYPLCVNGIWRHTCRCHYWQPIYHTQETR